MTGKAKESPPKPPRPRRTPKADQPAQAASRAGDAFLATGEVTPEERHQLIAITAYFISEHRGFLPGLELQDWLEAEVQVDQHLSAGPA